MIYVIVYGIIGCWFAITGLGLWWALHQDRKGL